MLKRFIIVNKIVKSVLCKNEYMNEYYMVCSPYLCPVLKTIWTKTGQQESLIYRNNDQQDHLQTYQKIYITFLRNDVTQWW